MDIPTVGGRYPLYMDGLGYLYNLYRAKPNRLYILIEYECIWVDPTNYVPKPKVAQLGQENFTFLCLYVKGF